MDLQFRCPTCGAIFQAGDSQRGTVYTCRQCTTQIMVPAASPVARVPAAPVVMEMAPPGPEREEFRRIDKLAPLSLIHYGSGWQLVQVAMVLMLVGWFIFLVCTLSFFFVGGFGTDSKGETTKGAMEAWGWAILVFGGAGLLLSLAGQGMCCAAPWRAGARGLAIAALITFTVAVITMSIFVVLLVQTIQRRAEPEGGLVVILVVAAVLFMAAVILLGLFCRSVGAFFQRRRLVLSALGFVIVYGAANLIITIFNLVVIYGAKKPGIWFVYTVVGEAAVGVVLLIMFVGLLMNTRTTIARAFRDPSGQAGGRVGA